MAGNKPVDTQRILDSTDGKGFYVPQTLAMAYGVFAAHDGQFTDSVYEAVNIGGDTDSLASIVATMSLFKNGGISKKPHDFEHTDSYERLMNLSRELTEAANK